MEHSPEHVIQMSEIDTNAGNLFQEEDSPFRRLHDTIQRAVGEIARLRDENTLLKDKISDLESSIQSRQDLFGDGSPEEIKEQIEGFINTIDSVLAEQKASPPTSK